MFEAKSGKKPVFSVPCLYHNRPGKENTQRTLEIAAQRAKELNIKNVLVASTSGETGLLAVRVIQTAEVIVVTHSTGFLKPDHQQMRPELKKQIEENGAKILTCQHALGGVGRAVRKN
jgi:hypothetical protein